MNRDQTRQAIAGEVRASLARAGHPAAWLADAADISKTALSLKLRGDRSFTAEELVRVAAALNLDPGALILDAAKLKAGSPDSQPAA